jgi:ATP-dependent DNA helicase RecQ
MPRTPRSLAPAPSTPVPAARIRRALRETFGLERLRDGQDRVIDHVLAGRPTLVLMPTGAGKSLCYQLPAVLLPGLTLVVSPLIALMKDQCDKLRGRGVDAHQLNSAVPADEQAEALAAIDAGRARIVFTTPERLADPAFLARVERHPVSLVAVDEAHCISQWGHDFRPAFLAVGEAIGRLGRGGAKPTVLALTATATEEVVADVAEQLGVGRFEVVQTDLYRPNLALAVQPVTNETERLEEAVRRVQALEGTGIVYAATVKVAEAVHAALGAAGVDAELYHGRLSAAERRRAQDAWMAGEKRVVVATGAFGLGIDKADVRFVLHAQMPSGLDAYYQEAGRAGRDGAPARCILLFLHADRAVQRFFLAGRYPSLEDLDALHRALLRDPPGGDRWTLDALHEALDLPASKLEVAVALLVRERVATRRRDGGIGLRRRGVGPVVLESLLAAYRDKRESDRAMLEGMVHYGQTGSCRWKVLLHHFDAARPFERCGGCDNCLRIAAAEGERASAPAEEPAEAARAARSEPIVYAAGTEVRVPRYGRGVVDGHDGDGIAVRFAGGVRRVFLPAFVKLAAAARALRRPRAPRP